MFSRGFNIFITVVMAILFAILYGVIHSNIVLWIGGLILFFWINGCIREAISDNYYINAAYTTLTACVLTVPQIFYGGTPFGWLLYAVTAGYQMLAFFTNYDYTSDYTVNRDFGRNWRSATKSIGQKIYGHYVIAQANWAAMILTGIGFLAGSFFLAALCSAYSLFFLLLIPIYTLLWNFIALFYIKLIVGIDAPTGYSDHERVDNILKGFWYLIGAVLGAILAVILAPFRWLVMLAELIRDFFANIKDGGSAELSKFFWICTGALGIYLILAFFNIADVIPRLFGDFGGVDLDFYRYFMVCTNFVFDLKLDGTFFLDVIMFLPKVILILLAALLDIVLILLVLILWLLLNLILFLLYFLLVISFELILPIALGIGAVVFLVLYLVESDRDFFDWFRAILFAILPIACLTLYFLLRLEILPHL